MQLVWRLCPMRLVLKVHEGSIRCSWFESSAWCSWFEGGRARCGWSWRYRKISLNATDSKVLPDAAGLEWQGSFTRCSLFKALPDAAGHEGTGKLHQMELVQKLFLMQRHKRALPDVADLKALPDAAGHEGIGALKVYLSKILLFIYCISSTRIEPDLHLVIYLWHTIFDWLIDSNWLRRLIYGKYKSSGGGSRNKILPMHRMIHRPEEIRVCKKLANPWRSTTPTYSTSKCPIYPYRRNVLYYTSWSGIIEHVQTLDGTNYDVSSKNMIKSLLSSLQS